MGPRRKRTDDYKTGNDVNGYWKIERAFEMMEPHIELHESKFPVAYELTMDQLREVMEARVASW